MTGGMGRFARASAFAAPCLLSALLLWAAFPPMGETCAAAFALAPMLAVSRLSSPKRGAWSWFAFGMAFWTATLAWMPAIVKNNGPLPLVLLGWFGLAALCAGYFALFGWLHARLWRRVAAHGGAWTRIAALSLAEPALWAGIEWLRSWLFTGFAWNFLGTAVGAVPSLVGPARLGGVYLVSALVVMLNGVFATLACRVMAQMRGGEGALRTWADPGTRTGRWLRPFETAVPLLLILAAHFAAAAVAVGGEAMPLRVALVQRNSPCIFSRRDAAENPFDAFGRLLESASAARPDLVVWAESAMAEFGLRLNQPETVEVARRFSQQTGGAALLSGGDWLEWTGTERRVHNSAALFAVSATNADVQAYWKQHLVPFGEYIPFDKWITPRQRLSPVGVSLWPGEPKVLRLERGGRSFLIAPLICFEDTDPVLARRAARMGAQVIVLVTNDSWFSNSIEPAQHAAQAVLRAVETGLPVVRAANSGVTGVVLPSGHARWLEDGDGKALVDGAGTMLDTVPVPVAPRLTPYSRLGDVPLAILFAVAVFVTLFGSLARRQR